MIGDTNVSGRGQQNYPPPEDCTDFKASGVTGKVMLTWTDPEDTELDYISFCAWAGTKLVRKEGGYPADEKDGITLVDSKIRNQYQITGFIDGDVMVGGTYYYALFPYSRYGIHNRDLACKKAVTPIAADPVLANNTWDTIAAVAKEGEAGSIWAIGDEIDIALGGAYEQKLTLQIADFNHDDLADGSGKAGITFVCKNLMRTTMRINNSQTSEGGWRESYMCKTNIPNILLCFPEKIQNCMVDVLKVSAINGGTSETGKYSEKLFMLSATEVRTGYYNAIEGEGYPIFTDGESRKKSINGGSGTYPWWLRSIDRREKSSFYRIESDGMLNTWRPSDKCGICFGFCI